MAIASDMAIGQTFLVGETVYLHPIAKADATYSVALRDTPYPMSPQRTEAWISEELAGRVPWGGEKTLAIRRRVDDVIVGSVSVHKGHNFLRWEVLAHVSPLFGQRGAGWKAEALDLMVTWLAEERQAVMVAVKLPAAEQAVIDRLTRSGMRGTTRFRERCLVDGKRVDQVILQRFNADWLETLGDPAEQALPQSGLGTPRPRPAQPAPDAKAPKNAVMVGKRVYLRPVQEADLETYVRWAREEIAEPFLLGRNLPMLAEELHYHHEDEQKDLPGFIPFVVCRKDDDAHIGEVALIHPDLVNRSAETASWFHHDFRGQGYGSEAKHLLLEYAFNTLGLHMVESWVRFENTRSAAALRKQGYREAGWIGWMSYRDGHFTNFVTFDLLVAEWRALPRA